MFQITRRFGRFIVAFSKRRSSWQPCSLAVLYLVCAPGAAAGTLVETVKTVKRSVVAVGTHLPTRSPAISFAGTGFVVGDGLSVITNSHVVPDSIDSERMESLGVVLSTPEGPVFRTAVLEVRDREHDLARLRLSGKPLPALRLGEPDKPAEGMAFAFTGFPLGVVLGLYPATHQALLSAITPAIIPVRTARRLDDRLINQLRQPVFKLYQLDATAYPGNSGSPLYDPETGVVFGIINMGLLKGNKENAITNPSGISYAVPVQFIHAIMQQKAL